MQNLKSTCPYCGVGCGVSVNVDNDQPSRTLVLGDKQHPANLGRLCSKGSALGETLLDAKQAKRLTQPLVDGEAVAWDTATQTIADKIASSIEQHGRESVAFYLSGQLLTEDYYVANKLMKGFIGTANVDTNSRLCMSSAVAAYKRAFGSDTVPCCYEDIDEAELIVLVGSNAAWTHPVLYQRMVAAKQANPNLKVVLIDPRKTATCDIADLHLAIKPSSDGFLFQGLLKYLIDTGSLNDDYISKNTDGFDQAKEVVVNQSLAATAQTVSVDETDLETFFTWFARTEKTLSFYSQGVNQSATGTDKCNAIINCHLATGKIGYAGAGPFSITGQPNAMGGREVGGLANMLAAHMDFTNDDCDRVRRFWNSPHIAIKPGLKAVDLFDAVSDGKIKVIWILATNPAVSLPNSNKVREALKRCPTVIVSDVTHNDTSAYADILLPAQAWSEKDGTVTNSERCISRQRSFRAAPGEAKPDWWALSEVAKKLGFESQFSFQNPHQIFIEHSQLSAFENGGTRAFDISGLEDLTATQYDLLAPIQWPVNAANPQGRKRMFVNASFFTDNARAKFVSGKPELAICVDQSTSRGSFVLNTGRLRDQWHTMTRTGFAASLTAHYDIPFVEMNVDDVENRQFESGDLITISNDYGEFIASVKPSKALKSGELFSPIHWTDQFATKAVITAAVSPEVDPVSGQPELKASAVKLRRFECLSWARVASTHTISKEGFDYWAETKTKRGYVTLVGAKTVLDWRLWSESQLRSDTQFMQYSDQANGAETIVATTDNSIEMLVHSGELVTHLPSYAWQSKAFDDNNMQTLTHLLRSESDGRDQLICSCFGVSRKTIQNSIGAGTQSVAELGLALGCGSKCGSCKPELSAMLQGNIY